MSIGAVKLAKGDLVLIYTDAMIEAESPHGERLGVAGLLKLVRCIDAQEPEKFCSLLLKCVATFRGHKPPDDDFTILLLHLPRLPPPQTEEARTMRQVCGYNIKRDVPFFFKQWGGIDKKKTGRMLLMAGRGTKCRSWP